LSDRNFAVILGSSSVPVMGVLFAVVGFLSALYLRAAGDIGTPSNYHDVGIVVAGGLFALTMAGVMSKMLMMGWDKPVAALLWSFLFGLSILIGFSMVIALISFIVVFLTLMISYLLPKPYAEKDSIFATFLEGFTGSIAYATFIAAFVIIISMFTGDVLSLTVLYVVAIVLFLGKLAVEYFTKEHSSIKQLTLLGRIRFIVMSGIGYGVVVALLFLQPAYWKHGFFYGVMLSVLAIVIPRSKDPVDIEKMKEDLDNRK